MVELKDIDGIISLPDVEGRFKGILSVQKIKDTMTGIEYNGVADTDFLILINELNDENEQLKKQMQRLYNYFADWHKDEIGGNQFSEMWDNVKEDEKWERRIMND